MNIQIKQIKGDIVELLFNPKEVDLRVGEILRLRENGNNRGLIVQIIAFSTVNYPSLLTEMLEMMADDPTVGAEMPALSPDSLPEASNIKLGIAKIRKVVQWNGAQKPQPEMADSLA